VLSFDEFKGNANGERFQCILTAPEERRILDILPDRKVSTIQSYLRPFSNRAEVQYVVMDMNQGYRDIAKTFFPNAKIVIDRFHVVRYCTWAMDNVRRDIQKSLLPATRKYFKRSRKLLTVRRNALSDEDKAAVDVMLNFSEKLYQAYALKELFFEFMDAKSSSAAAELLSKWFDACDRLHLPEFKACRRMLKNWKPYILNAFDCPYSNGFTESCNNGIKTLKRIAFGFRNFHNFRARILLSANPAYPNI
jgi:transposase